jgi:hypothetical protein
LRAKLLFERYHVSSVSKVGAFYMIDFPVGTRMDTLRAILELDTEREATVLSGTRIRIAQKPFITDTIFLKEYIRRMEDLPK